MPLKIIFMGTPHFAIPIIKSICNSDHNILCVYTQPPKKKDRGQKKNITPIHEFANTMNLEIRHPKSIDVNEIEYIKNLNPDVVVVVAYGKILPTKLLSLDKIKFINVHASLLPKLRGAAPIQRAIMNLEKETGISIMKIEPKLDTGPILMKSKIDINEGTTYEVLSNELSKIGSELILRSLKLICRKADKYFPQDEQYATYAKKIKKNESKINWNTKAKNLIANINALNPNPGCWFYLKGSRIKIIKAVEVEANSDPGIILDNKFTISCSENAVQILELKKEGKKIIKASEFLKGNNLKIGLKLDNHV